MRRIKLWPLNPVYATKSDERVAGKGCIGIILLFFAVVVLGVLYFKGVI